MCKQKKTCSIPVSRCVSVQPSAAAASQERCRRWHARTIAVRPGTDALSALGTPLSVEPLRPARSSLGLPQQQAMTRACCCSAPAISAPLPIVAASCVCAASLAQADRRRRSDHVRRSRGERASERGRVVSVRLRCCACRCVPLLPASATLAASSRASEERGPFCASHPSAPTRLQSRPHLTPKSSAHQKTHLAQHTRSTRIGCIERGVVAGQSFAAAPAGMPRPSESVSLLHVSVHSPHSPASASPSPIPPSGSHGHGGAARRAASACAAACPHSTAAASPTSASRASRVRKGLVALCAIAILITMGQQGQHTNNNNTTTTTCRRTRWRAQREHACPASVLSRHSFAPASSLSRLCRAGALYLPRLSSYLWKPPPPSPADVKLAVDRWDACALRPADESVEWERPDSSAHVYHGITDAAAGHHLRRYAPPSFFTPPLTSGDPRGAPVEDVVYTQQAWQLGGMFLTCPRDTPIIRIQKAHTGNICGFEPRTRDPRGAPFAVSASTATSAATAEREIFPFSTNPNAELHPSPRAIRDARAFLASTPRDGVNLDACSVDSTAQVQLSCSGRRSCCINHAHLPADPCPQLTPKIALVSWTCESVRSWYDVSALKPEEAKAWNADVGTMKDMETGVALPAAPALPTLAASPSALSLLLPPPSPPPPRSCLLSTSLIGWDPVKNGCGLFNQLMAMISLLSVAWEAQCNITVDAFMPDFDSVRPVEFSRVFDLPAINRKLAQERLNEYARIANETSALESPSARVRSARPRRVSPSLSSPVLSTPSIFDTPDSLGYRAHTDPFNQRCASTFHWMASTLQSNLSLFHSYTTLLRANPNPGLLFLGQGWGSWTMQGNKALDAYRAPVLRSLTFTPPFVAAARALQAAFGLKRGRYTTIHFRFEDDMSVMADLNKIPLKQMLDQIWANFITQWEDACKQAKINGQDPAHAGEPHQVYLATGIRSENVFVQRFRALYPHMRIHTKDSLLADLCAADAAAHPGTPMWNTPTSQAAPLLGDSKLDPALVSTFLRAISRLPWIGGARDTPLAACGWVRGLLPNPPNREFWAILDYMVASESGIFVGYGGSTMSWAVKATMEARGERITGEDTDRGKDGKIRTFKQFRFAYH